MTSAILCSICKEQIDVDEEVASGRVVWQYVEGFVPLAKPGKPGGINRMRLASKHDRFAHDWCLKQSRRVVYGDDT